MKSKPISRVVLMVAAVVPALMAVRAACAGVEASSDAVSSWGGKVWEAALRRDSGESLGLLTAPPAEAPGLAPYTSELRRYEANMRSAEQRRVERIALVRSRLAEADAKGELLEGLRNAIELYTLEKDKPGVLTDPAVTRLEATALATAREHESAGRWLEAHGLFTRLHLLHEIEGTYKPDLKRLGARILMMRTYVPEALHEARNRQRQAEGEEPLPPFNDLGENWRTRLAGIDEQMVRQALTGAAVNHVERVPLKTMLVGALSNVRTMATTSDLAKAFEGLSDEAKRTAFVSKLDQMITDTTAEGERADAYFALRTLSNLAKANAETVGLAPEALLHEFANGATSVLDDYSEVIWPDELANFSRTTTGEFSGVGIQITLDDAMQLKVVTPLEGTPAARAGIRPGDIIRRIDGRDTTGIALQQAVDRITGPLGTRVSLGLERDGEDGLIDVELVRAKIPVHSVKGWERTGPGEMDWNWFIDQEHKVGYIRLTQFTKDTTRDFLAAVASMRATGLNGLVLDLRYNPGGLLDEAVSLCSLFVDQGPIVSQQDASGRQTDVQNARPGSVRLGNLPVAVLINEGSASASEIVSGCLQDYSKAVIVGERSFGKGSVQQVFPLGGGQAAFKLTMQYYKLPKGRLVHRRDAQATWGVEPDVKVEVLPSQVEAALILRQDADLYTTDEKGARVPPMVRAPKPRKNPKPGDEADLKHWPVGPAAPERLLSEGMDPQLETALMLVQAKALANDATAKTAALKN